MRYLSNVVVVAALLSVTFAVGAESQEIALARANQFKVYDANNTFVGNVHGFVLSDEVIGGQDVLGLVPVVGFVHDQRRIILGVNEDHFFTADLLYESGDCTGPPHGEAAEFGLPGSLVEAHIVGPPGDTVYARTGSRINVEIFSVLDSWTRSCEATGGVNVLVYDLNPLFDLDVFLDPPFEMR